jgi:hypothetical protein
MRHLGASTTGDRGGQGRIAARRHHRSPGEQHGQPAGDGIPGPPAAWVRRPQQAWVLARHLASASVAPYRVIEYTVARAIFATSARWFKFTVSAVSVVL